MIKFSSILAGLIFSYSALAATYDCKLTVVEGSTEHSASGQWVVGPQSADFSVGDVQFGIWLKNETLINPYIYDSKDKSMTQAEYDLGSNTIKVNKWVGDKSVTAVCAPKN